ncbi:hypothetical protein JOM49_004140 [Amycolatopsis magusensis]|uniref:K+-transporting ATPase, KdpF subunit n=1 Tax=Amycolatopsis magusensis TaxID=882444 RepID=A0ABS4PT55_9PSEU|nr:hypothetical protein [Amycolatopsis magusensis]
MTMLIDEAVATVAAVGLLLAALCFLTARG